MSASPLSILQVSTADVLGGAERIAFDLFRAYRERGHRANLAVGRRRTDDPDVLLMTHDRGVNPWRSFWWGLHARLQPRFNRIPAARQFARIFQSIAEPKGALDRHRGIEDLCFPAAWRLLDLPPQRPDILHCHNLHGNYFDLRALPRLSRSVPVVMTLHDAWLLAGHCAHSFDCERWMTGCGQCPDLKIYPAIQRDATDENHRRKSEIFSQCRLYVATPCQWLMDKVMRSCLAPAIVEARVIPNGVDLTVFKPADKAAARDCLGLPQDADILLFAAYGVTRNSFKDYATLRRTAGIIAERRSNRAGSQPKRPLLVIALGESGRTEHLGAAEIRMVPHVSDPHVVARYHQAADIYIHASRADTFPTSILEAMACGTPVVATAVGGIPEQIKPLSTYADCSKSTGAIVPARDAESMASRVEAMLDDRSLQARLGDNAACHARRHFELGNQVSAYLDWYGAILNPRISTAQRKSLSPTLAHA